MLAAAGMTIRRLLNDGRQRLLGKTETPRLDAELLLCEVLACSRVRLISHNEQTVDELSVSRYHDFIRQRESGAPIAYLIGRREFWSLDFAVNEHTLIPRPETELLVEKSLELIPATATWDLADLGTGCGAIAIALATERSACRVVATDRSEGALAVAAKNAMRLHAGNVTFRHGDWYAPIHNERFNIIVSNPPYVMDDDPCLRQGDPSFEPAGALQAGDDGLAAIRILVQDACEHLLEGGWLVLEHGTTQGAGVRALFIRHGFAAVTTHTDLSSHERMTMGKNHVR